MRASIHKGDWGAMAGRGMPGPADQAEDVSAKQPSRAGCQARARVERRFIQPILSRRRRPAFGTTIRRSAEVVTAVAAEVLSHRTWRKRSLKPAAKPQDRQDEQRDDQEHSRELDMNG